MKKSIMLVMLAAGCSAQEQDGQLSGTNVLSYVSTNSPGFVLMTNGTLCVGSNALVKSIIISNDYNGTITLPSNTIPRLVAGFIQSGALCEARGHAWMAHKHDFGANSDPNIMGCRVCHVCGFHQNRIGEWK